MEAGHLVLLTMLKLMVLPLNLHIPTQLEIKHAKFKVEPSKLQAMYQLQVALVSKTLLQVDQYQSLLMLPTGVLTDQEFSPIALPQSTTLSS